jgi:geranylgeranyl diphosphate synthase type II
VSTIAVENAPAEISTFMDRVAPLIERDLDARFALDENQPEPVRRLLEATRYAVLGPGKRLRPAIVLAAAEACGGTIDEAMPAAAAIESLHAYTLVHDDLPAMDDDDLRRGRKTVHREFDESTAILAGDALLTSAFAFLAELRIAPAEAVQVLARRSGSLELLAGQMLDLASKETDATTLPELERMHAGKTGALFAASAELGGIAAGTSATTREALGELGLAIGVAFQFADDADDGDFVHLLQQTVERRAALAERATECIEVLNNHGANTQLLAALAQWFTSA